MEHVPNAPAYDTVYQSLFHIKSQMEATTELSYRAKRRTIADCIEALGEYTKQNEQSRDPIVATYATFYRVWQILLSRL